MQSTMGIHVGWWYFLDTHPAKKFATAWWYIYIYIYIYMCVCVLFVFCYMYCGNRTQTVLSNLIFIFDELVNTIPVFAVLLHWFKQPYDVFTQQGGAPHKCIIILGNGSSPFQRLTSIWPDADLLSFESLVIRFSEIWIKIQQFDSK